MNCPENQQTKNRWEGVEVLGGKKSEVREISWTAEKIDTFF